VTEPPELDRPPADPVRIIEVLESHGVDYLVVGGLAVIAHGYPRITLDADILPSPDASNMRRVAAALAELNAAAVGARGERLGVDLSHPDSLALGDHFLTTDAGALDLVNGHRPDLLRYRRLQAAAVDSSLGGHPIRVISKDDLIDMKREAGRPKDLADIAALTEVERGGGLDR
jgi:hypothetical protein